MFWILQETNLFEGVLEEKEGRLFQSISAAGASLIPTDFFII